MEGNKTKRKRKLLSSDETYKFIDVWQNYVEDLRSNRKNNHIIKNMEKDLKEIHGVELDPGGIRNRMNNLTKQLRLEKQKVGTSGGSPSEWEYFEIMNGMLGHFKSNRMHELAIETIIDENQENEAEHQSPLISPLSPSSSASTSSIRSTGSSVTPLSKKSENKQVANRILEIAEDEHIFFKKFCDKLNEREERKISLLEDNNCIQRELIDILKNNLNPNN